MSAPAGSPEPQELLSRPELRLSPGYRSDEAGPLELAWYWDQPLVRAARTSSRRSARAVAAVCVALPPLVLLLCAVGLGQEAGAFPSFAGMAAGAFLVVWPLLMCLGAAFRSAGRVVAERSGNTALQLVLTPIDKRPIAAAMVVPHAWPFLLGAAAALPLCALAAAGAEDWGLLAHPLCFWPFRLGAVPFVRLGLDARGAAMGLVAGAADVAWVWAAAHWGAAYAVRLASLPGTSLYLAWRFLWTSAAFAVWYGLAMGVSIGLWMVEMFAGGILASALMAAAAAAVVAAFWWSFLLPRAGRLALEEFAHFDRLADEEFEIKPVRLPSMFRDYGERP